MRVMLKTSFWNPLSPPVPLPPPMISRTLWLSSKSCRQWTALCGLVSAICDGPSIVEFLQTHDDFDAIHMSAVLRFRAAIELLGEEATKLLRQGTSLHVTSQAAAELGWARPTAVDLFYELNKAWHLVDSIDPRLAELKVNRLAWSHVSDGDSFGLALVDPDAIRHHSQRDEIRQALKDSPLAAAVSEKPKPIFHRVRLVRLAVWAAWKHCNEAAAVQADAAAAAAPNPAGSVTADHINNLFHRGICHPVLFDAIPGMMKAHHSNVDVRIISRTPAADGADPALPIHAVPILFFQGRYEPLFVGEGKQKSNKRKRDNDGAAAQSEDEGAEEGKGEDEQAEEDAEAEGAEEGKGEDEEAEEDAEAEGDEDADEEYDEEQEHRRRKKAKRGGKRKEADAEGNNDAAAAVAMDESL